MKRFATLLLALGFISSASAKISPNRPTVNGALLKRYSVSYKNNIDILKLKKDTLKLKGKAIPTLVEVMKDGKYPDKNRWMATFLVGQIAGKKSAPLISKYAKHPSWVMRMASLKTLLALKEDKYQTLYIKSLKDNSMLVRSQALDNIKELNLTKASPYVWSMLYDKKNYHVSKKGKTNKRLNIIKKVITTVGDLKFEKARDPLLKMIQKEKYKDIFKEVEYSLSKITGKKIPDGSLANKKRYWNKVALSYKTF